MMDWQRAHYCAPRRILLKVCVCVCVCTTSAVRIPGCLPPPVFDFGYECVRWCGSVFRWRHSARRCYRLVKFLSPRRTWTQLRISMQERTLRGGKVERIFNRRKDSCTWTSICVCVRFWRAGCQPPRHMVCTQVMSRSPAQAFFCVRVCVGAWV